MRARARWGGLMSAIAKPYLDGVDVEALVRALVSMGAFCDQQREMLQPLLFAGVTDAPELDWRTADASIEAEWRIYGPHWPIAGGRGMLPHCFPLEFIADVWGQTMAVGKHGMIVLDALDIDAAAQPLLAAPTALQGLTEPKVRVTVKPTDNPRRSEFGNPSYYVDTLITDTLTRVVGPLVWKLAEAPARQTDGLPVPLLVATAEAGPVGAVMPCRKDKPTDAAN